jgi:hypothetical protein
MIREKENTINHPPPHTKRTEKENKWVNKTTIHMQENKDLEITS